MMMMEDLYGEPLGRGWGVDIAGYGPSLNLSHLQAHSLKLGTERNEDGHMGYKYLCRYIYNIYL